MKQIPLAALAWQRIGVSCIVILVGEQRKFKESPTRRMVLDMLKLAGARVYFLYDPFLERLNNSRLSALFAQVCFSGVLCGEGFG